MLSYGEGTAYLSWTLGFVAGVFAMINLDNTELVRACLLITMAGGITGGITYLASRINNVQAIVERKTIEAMLDRFDPLSVNDR